MVFLTITGLCQENKYLIVSCFWHFSVRYNVSFIKMIRISMPHRLKVFSRFFIKFHFLAFKKKILRFKITAIFFYQFVLNIYSTDYRMNRIMFIAQIYPVRVNGKQKHTTYTYTHTNMRRKIYDLLI